MRNWLLRGKKPTWFWAPVVSISDTQKVFTCTNLDCLVQEYFPGWSLFFMQNIKEYALENVSSDLISLHIALIGLKWLSCQRMEETSPKNNTKPVLKCVVVAAVWRCFFLLTKARPFMTRIVSKGDKSHFRWLETHNLENDSVSKWFWMCSRWVSPWKMVVQMSELSN